VAEIVLGVAASHTTLMNTQWDKVDHLPRAHAFRDALGQAAAMLHEARPDAVVILGSNHFRGFWLDLMPAFTIGVGEVIAAGEHGTPAGALPCNPATALAVCEGMMARDFDCAFSSKLSVDHGISHAVQWLMPELNVPIIPIVINCFAPPLPTLGRVSRFGEALRGVLESLTSVDRVAVIATGGLSHALPFPDWRRPEGDDEEFIAHSWKEGRGRWQEFETRRRSIIVNAPPRLNEEFDRWFLARFESEGLRRILDELGDEELVLKAGNGGNEIRAWIALSQICSNRPADVLVYSPMPEWLTGMAVAVVTPN